MPAEELRSLLPALGNKHYFNYGGQGPLPTPSLEAMVACWRELQRLGPFSRDVWPFVEAETSALRRRLAQLCGVPPHRLSLTENVTSGCVLPLWGLPFEPGDSLLLSDAEHPGVVAACQELARRQGLTISWFSARDCRSDAALLESLEAALEPSTRLVVLSHLLWNSGLAMPIEAVAARLKQHPRHPWLLVDAAQSMGSLELGGVPAAADIYAFTGHKWCCGPEGLGGVALSERVLEQSQPTVIGWRSLRNENSSGSQWHHDGRRFEVATSCIPLGAGLRRSLDLLEQLGNAQQRQALICERSARLWNGLQKIPAVQTVVKEAPPASGLVSFTIDHTPAQAAVSALADQHFQLRSLEDPLCLRACTHVFSTESEIDQLLEAISQL
ncbi:MAG: aminotransferase class V-fold PLP-dependent enzyme [Cyanobacteriota bacterium]|nr:aminotransferase class V-fold PLP-dependent enzyme [Cyanobacteriota bacterium]